MRRTTTAIGRSAEASARRYLEQAGYRIVAENWTVRGAEVDLVALDGDTLVFVEVRARRATGASDAESTVDARKLERIMLAADAFVQRHPEFLDSVWRIDLIAIATGWDGGIVRLGHYENLTIE